MALYAVLFLLLGLIILNWLLPTSASFLPGNWMQMQSNTAISLFLATCSSLTFKIRKRKLRNIARATFTVLILIFLLNSVFGFSSHSEITALNRFLVSSGNLDNVFPVSIQSVLSIFLMSLLPLFNARSKGPAKIIYDVLLSVLFIIMLFFAGSYIFNATRFVSVDENVLLSFYTLICLWLLLLINLFVKKRRSIYGVFLTNGTGGEISRNVFFPTIFLIFFFLSVTQNTLLQEVLTINLSFAIITAVMISGIGLLIIFMAGNINDLEQKLHYLATKDDMTGLLNRRGLQLIADQALKAARRESQVMTLIYMDLDNLKAINDKYGHKLGSDMIVMFCDCLKKIFRKNDILSRIGGDEFVVLSNARKEGLEDAISRLEKKISEYKEYVAIPKFSYGFAEINPLNNDSLEEIISKADARMYINKSGKKEGNQE